MTEKEAIKYIKCRMRSGKTKDEVWQAGDMAIKAIEKQIPTKPIKKQWGADIEVTCPNCGDNRIISGSKKGNEYCAECGIKFDWSEEDEGEVGGMNE